MGFVQDDGSVACHLHGVGSDSVGTLSVGTITHATPRVLDRSYGGAKATVEFFEFIDLPGVALTATQFAQVADAIENDTLRPFTQKHANRLVGIEENADVTDAVNVAAAGAPIITTGAGAPASTPAAEGDIYVDTTNDNVYAAAGTASSADWKQATGAGGGDLLAANNLSDLANAGTARTNLGVAIGSDVQAHSAVLDATTASFLIADETKLDALDTNLQTITLPASTTISSFGASIVDDADAAAVLTTLGVDTDITTATIGASATLTGSNTGDEPAAALDTAGIVELATIAETDTGTDATRAVTPDGLAGSIYGQKEVGIVAYASDVATAIANGDVAYVIPASMAGMDLIDVTASTYTAGVTGQTDVQVRRSRAGTDADMLSTKVTITAAAYTASDGVIDTANDDVNEGDMIFVDCDAICTGTAANGLSVTLTFGTA